MSSDLHHQAIEPTALVAMESTKSGPRHGSVIEIVRHRLRQQ